MVKKLLAAEIKISIMTKEKCVLSLEYTDNFFIVNLRMRKTQYKVDSSDNNLLDDKSNNTPKDSNVNI